MDRPLRLPQQDRADFETELGRALSAPQVRAALRASGDEVHGVERLRRTARESAEFVLAAAAPEYERYVVLRADADAVARLPVDAPSRDRASGWWGVLGLVVPVIAVGAALIFLVLGALLGLAEDLEVLSRALVDAGWVSAGAAAVSLLVGGAGLLGTARSKRAEAGEVAGGPDELVLAREAWRSALAERGLLPYLLAQASAVDGRRR
ncbi:hypothetical protein [Kitasatospora brasiliensis]|uniref:hypothetical protein n=1 Tax=Kitasatospora brasiliensis TaxID=3058040 RepID=UPI00292F8C3A|nr:hypothetical protein [Kitasatospora sp. K002]